MSNVAACRFCLMFFAALACPPARADEELPAAGQDMQVSVLRDRDDFNVSASLLVSEPPCVVYAVLTDYTRLPEFIPGMQEVGVERISDHEVRVRQVASVHVLFFHIRMYSTVEMEETPNQLITFRQTEGDLAAYSGEWRLTPVGEGTRLSYSASLRFKGYVPGFIARAKLEQEIGTRFAAIEIEAQARSKQQTRPCQTAH